MDFTTGHSIISGYMTGRLQEVTALQTILSKIADAQNEIATEVEAQVAPIKVERDAAVAEKDAAVAELDVTKVALVEVTKDRDLALQELKDAGVEHKKP